MLIANDAPRQNQGINFQILWSLKLLYNTGAYAASNVQFIDEYFNRRMPANLATYAFCSVQHAACRQIKVNSPAVYKVACLAMTIATTTLMWSPDNPYISMLELGLNIVPIALSLAKA